MTCHGSDRIDGLRIGGEVTHTIEGRAGALAQHIKGIAALMMRASAIERLLDCLAEHEMGAQEPHCLPGRGANGRQAEPLDHALEDRVRSLAGLNYPCRDTQGPGGGRDQEHVRFDFVRRPVSTRKLVLDQSVGGHCVRDPQQRLRQNHQGEALLGGERISMQKILDAAEPAPPGADALDQSSGAGVDPTSNRR